jgi:hypothetical protein
VYDYAFQLEMEKFILDMGQIDVFDVSEITVYRLNFREIANLSGLGVNERSREVEEIVLKIQNLFNEIINLPNFSENVEILKIQNNIFTLDTNSKLIAYFIIIKFKERLISFGIHKNYIEFKVSSRNHHFANLIIVLIKHCLATKITVEFNLIDLLEHISCSIKSNGARILCFKRIYKLSTCYIVKMLILNVFPSIYLTHNSRKYQIIETMLDQGKAIKGKALKPKINFEIINDQYYKL